MNKFKCFDCGKEFKGNLSFCPDCGCPSSSCQRIEEQEMTKEEPIRQQTTNDEQLNTVKQQSSQPYQKNLNSNYPQPQTPKRKAGTFEIVCYVFAGICAFLCMLQQTTSGGYVNFDGSNLRLFWEIAAFSWLIVGRLTALVNK